MNVAWSDQIFLFADPHYMLRQFRCLHFEPLESDWRFIKAGCRDVKGTTFEIRAVRDGDGGADGAPSAVDRAAKRPVAGPDASASGCAPASRGV